MTPSSAVRRGDRLPLAVLAGLVLASVVAFQWLGRGTEPYFDEWTWITERRGMNPSSLLDAHNGHFSLVPVLIYKGLLQVFGLDHYWGFRLVLLGFHGACATLVYVYARARVGAVAALAPVTLLLILGAAAQDLLWAFQIGFLCSLAGGVAALLLLDSDRRFARWGAAAALMVSLASSGLGLVFLAAIVVEVAFDRDRSRVPAVAAPAVVYAAWFLAYGRDGGGTASIDNVPILPSYAADMGGAALTGAFGLGDAVAPTLIVLAVVAVLARLLTIDRQHDGRLLAVVAAPLVWWGLTGLSRGQLGDPGASRYIYPSVVLMLLLAVELAPRVPQRVLPLRVVAVAVAVLAVAGVGNVADLRRERDFLLTQARQLRAQTGALALLGPAIDPHFLPGRALAPGVNAGTFAAAQRDFGPVADSPAELAGASADARLVADEVLVQANAARVVPASASASVSAGGRSPTPPTPQVLGAGALTRRGGCVNLRGGAAQGLDVPIPAGGAVRVRVSGSATVQWRRFGDQPSGGVPPAVLPDGDSELRTVPDRGAPPWRARIAGSDRIAVCAAG